MNPNFRKSENPNMSIPTDLNCKIFENPGFRDSRIPTTEQCSSSEIRTSGMPASRNTGVPDIRKARISDLRASDFFESSDLRTAENPDLSMTGNQKIHISENPNLRITAGRSMPYLIILWYLLLLSRFYTVCRATPITRPFSSSVCLSWIAMFHIGCAANNCFAGP